MGHTKTHDLTQINPFGAAISTLGKGWWGKPTPGRIGVCVSRIPRHPERPKHNFFCTHIFGGGGFAAAQGSASLAELI